MSSCKDVKHKELNNRSLPITDLRFELCFSMIFSVSCNMKSENDEFRRFLFELNVSIEYQDQLSERLFFCITFVS